MPVICPTVTAQTEVEYKEQIKTIAGFAKRIQIDLMDGVFAPHKSVEPASIWWPVGVTADVHLMYKNPRSAAAAVLKHQPDLVIIHSEADGDFEEIYRLCRHNGVKLGLALLPSTQPQAIERVLAKIDHILIFSGTLGEFGGYANLELLDKAAYLKQKRPDLEIGWDGGINDRNISELVLGGVDVLNVGGYIEQAENAEKAYNTLFRIAEETGTT